jgi:ABC-2 type transport system permease protein
MNTLADMLWIETRKVTRSRMPLYTALAFLVLPAACAFLIFLYKNPELSRQLGILSAKANLVAGVADWPAYLELVVQAIAAGGFFLFCIVASWIFGREFVDGTLKDLLAVPVPRRNILLAKFIVLIAWCAALTVEVYLGSLAAGALVGLPAGTPAAFQQGLRLLLVTVSLAIVDVLPFAFLASVGRGYLLPLGMAVLAAVFANLVVITGWGEFFPWAVPGLISQGIPVGSASYVLVLLTGLGGMLATYLWWMYADQNR